MSDEKSNELGTLLRFFKVLSNETRLKILGLLANRERNVGDLADLLDVKEPTVSHHLAMMKELGLVDVRAEGTNRIYRLETKALERMNRDVFSRTSLSTLVEADTEDAWERKVLQSFLDGERIRSIPAKEKKRLVVLRWLASKFDPDLRYTEAEVNEIIKRHDSDYASWRRYLIDYGYMQREGGVYWCADQQGSEA